MSHQNRVIIVDDEEPGRIMLRYALQEHANWQIEAEFSNVADARAYLQTNTVDVVFLDIQMPKETGLGLARSISTMAHAPLIIFVTAYHAHAIEAFEVHALDYVLKPFNGTRFEQAIARATEMLDQRRGYAAALSRYVLTQENTPSYLQQVVVRSVGEMECIKLDDVFWIASASNYVELHLVQRVVLHRLPLSNLEKLISPKEFMRVHRSTIVRIDQLQSISVVGDGTYSLKLFCGAEVAVSEKYIEQVRTALCAGD